MLDMITLIIIGAGVLQLPLVMDLIQHLFPHSRVGRAVTRAMRVTLTCGMVFSVTSAVHMHFTLLLREHVRGYANHLTPEEEADDASSFTWILHPRPLLHALFSVWVYAQVLSHFYRACTQSPSRIHRSVDSALTTGDATKAGASASWTANDQQDDDTERVCKLCRVPKLLRTHHCRICNACVELMDHHCPFTGNCVGLVTFRSFWLWVCYGFLGITYACYISFAPFRYCWYDGFFTSRHGDAATVAVLKAAWREQRGELCARLGRGAYLFLPAVFGWCSTAFVFAFQSVLLASDQTTIEYLKGLTEFKVRVKPPAEVKADEERRRKRREEGRKRRNAATTDGANEDAEEEAVELDDTLGSHAADLMESGSPVASSPTSNSSVAPSPHASSVAGYAYNPHKSFRLLIFQDRPWWTLVVPPFLLRDSAAAHARSKDKRQA